MLTIFTVVTATGVSMFLILLFVDIRRKKRMLGQQKMIAEAEAALLRERLETAGKELTSQALFLATLSDSRARFSEVVEQVLPHADEEGKRILRSALKEFAFKIDHDAWTEFEHHFTRVNDPFYISLHRLQPTLTSAEKRLCALMKLNLSTKEIAMIQNKSVRGVESARYRLKKRLGLGENDDVYTFLNSI